MQESTHRVQGSSLRPEADHLPSSRAPLSMVTSIRCARHLRSSWWRGQASELTAVDADLSLPRRYGSLAKVTSALWPESTVTSTRVRCLAHNNHSEHFSSWVLASCQCASCRVRAAQISGASKYLCSGVAEILWKRED